MRYNVTYDQAKNSPSLRLAHRCRWGGEGDTGGAQDVSGCAYLYFTVTIEDNGIICIYGQATCRFGY